MENKYLEFNEEEYKKLFELYNIAINTNSATIKFQDKELTTYYTKYLLEYLEQKYKL